MRNTNVIRFVTPEEFAEILKVVEAPARKGSQREFPEWFALALRTLFATGCRPSEVVGTKGRTGREEEEGRGPRVSRVKPHHGIRACDVLPNHRLTIWGKNTTPAGRTHELKQRIVLCADSQVYAALQRLAEKRMAEGRPDANLFLPDTRNGHEFLRDQTRKLQRRLPPKYAHFSPRVLRHSHCIAAIRNGIDLVSIQRQVGHESLQTTAIYLRFAGLDEERYLSAFSGGRDEARVEKRDCPSCGFSWNVDARTGALAWDARMGVVMRKRRA